MAVSQKCLYAMRAVFELMKRKGEARPLKIAEIARNQNIPPRFLESILSELKAAGFVDSRRGSEGGYFMAMNTDSLSLGHIIEFVDGPLEPVPCINGSSRNDCNFLGQCVFLDVWKDAHSALTNVYYQRLFRDLVELDKKQCQAVGTEYCI